MIIYIAVAVIAGFVVGMVISAVKRDQAKQQKRIEKTGWYENNRVLYR